MNARMSRLLVRLGLSAGVFAIFMLHTAGVRESRLLETLENVTYDARVLLSMPGTVDPKVVIVDLDEKSMAAEGQWPWPRDLIGTLVTQLFDRYAIKVIGFDMVFPEADRASGAAVLDKLAAGPLAGTAGFADRLPEIRQQLDTDTAFAAALKGRNTVLGYAFRPVPGAGETGADTPPGPFLIDRAEASAFSVPFWEMRAVTGNLPVLQEASSFAGYFDLPTLDSDGIVRDVPLVQKFGGRIYPALSLQTLRVALGNPEVRLEFDPPEARTGLNLERLRVGEVVIPVDETVSAMVPYRGRERSFPYVPATDVIRGTADPAVLKDAIVLLGTTAAGLRDLRATPVGQGYPGVEVHANVISGALEGRIKQRAPYYSGMETVMLLAIGLGMALLFASLSPLASFGLAVAAIAAVTGLAFWLWNGANLVLPLGVPIALTLTTFLVQQLYGFLIETRRSRDISKRFGEYVPPEIVEEMAANPGAVSMEGQTREMTILFSDVRGFTSISEKLDAKELSELMNQFLSLLTKVIQKHRGTIDKYMGDAIMAFWGAPLPDDRHAEHALAAARELPQALRTLDEAFEKRGWPRLKIGVGLSTGVVRVGNMGSEFRRAYTVMGDPVNLASRVEGLTKEYGAAVMCSEFARAKGPSDWSYRELDQVRVKGKDQPVALYEPMGPKESLPPDLRNDLARHRGALKQYRAQQWDAAEAEFFSLSRGKHPHPVYELFLERIAYYRKNPPPANWDGVFTFKTK